LQDHDSSRLIYDGASLLTLLSLPPQYRFSSYRTQSLIAQTDRDRL